MRRPEPSAALFLLLASSGLAFAEELPPPPPPPELVPAPRSPTHAAAPEPIWVVPTPAPTPPPPPRPKARRRRVLISDFRAGETFPADLGRTLGDVAVREAARIEGWEIVTKSDVVARLGIEHGRQMLGCAADSSCLAELAGALDAERSLGGSVTAAEGGVLVVVTLTDTRQVTTVRTRSELLRSGKLDDLGDAVGRLTYEVITGKPPDATGILDIEVEEEGTVVVVDGVYSGQAPFRESRRVAPGPHRVVVYKDDAIRFASDVRVEPSGRTTVRPHDPETLTRSLRSQLPWGGPYWYVGAEVARNLAALSSTNAGMGSLRVGWDTKPWLGLEAWASGYDAEGTSSPSVHDNNSPTAYTSKLQFEAFGAAAILRPPEARSLGLRLAAGAGPSSTEVRRKSTGVQLSSHSGAIGLGSAEILWSPRLWWFRLELAVGLGILVPSQAKYLSRPEEPPAPIAKLIPLRLGLGVIWPREPTTRAPARGVQQRKPSAPPQ